MTGIYVKLFREFFKAGLFAIGGGMATVPFLQETGNATGWFTSAELADMIAISESTPGPIGVNMATYVGNVTAGIPGGIIATLGLVTPSVIIILIVATVLKKFRDNKYVNSAFYGLRPASVGLISAAGFAIILIAFFGAEDIYDLFRNFTGVDYRYVLLAVILVILTDFVKPTKKLHPILFILFSAVAGIVFRF